MQGIIIAIDKITNKIDTIKKKCNESLITCVHPFAFDSTKAVLEDSNISCNVLEGPPFALETFDKVLLDVPCSALGQRPLLSNKMTVKMLRSYVPLQRKLFQAVSTSDFFKLRLEIVPRVIGDEGRSRSVIYIEHTVDC